MRCLILQIEPLSIKETIIIILAISNHPTSKLLFEFINIANNMLCSSTFKNGKPCSYKAKYAINNDDSQCFVCIRHVVSVAKQILGIEIKSVKNVSQIVMISDVDTEPDATILDVFAEAITLIKETTGLDIEKRDAVPTICSNIEYYDVSIDGDEFKLMICKEDPTMTDLYEAVCIQIGLKGCNAFLPMKSYEVLGRTYFVSKMVHVGTKTTDSLIRRVPYFYQLCHSSKPLREFKFEDHSLKVFVNHMCKLIENLQSSRMCFGDFNFETLLFTDLSDATSAFIDSAINVSFWIDTHGEFKSEDLPSLGTKFPLTASRRIHAKKAAGRYDDFESLLYLVLTIKGKILPWDEAANIRDSNHHKKCFLEDPSLYLKSSDSLNEICDLIIHSQFDERPNYERLAILFEEIL